jgi:Sigma-70 region 2
VSASREPDLDEVTGLALAARDGDRAALEELCRAVQQPMYRLALRFCGNPADAEDAAQEVLIRLVTNLGSFEGRSRFTTWAYTEWRCANCCAPPVVGPRRLSPGPRPSRRSSTATSPIPLTSRRPGSSTRNCAPTSGCRAPTVIGAQATVERAAVTNFRLGCQRERAGLVEPLRV